MNNGTIKFDSIEKYLEHVKENSMFPYLAIQLNYEGYDYEILTAKVLVWPLDEQGPPVKEIARELKRHKLLEIDVWDGDGVMVMHADAYRYPNTGNISISAMMGERI